MRMLGILLLGLQVPTACAATTPCDVIDRSLPKERQESLAPVIAQRLGSPKVDILQLFRFKGWSIIYVETYQSDAAFCSFQESRNILFI